MLGIYDFVYVILTAVTVGLAVLIRNQEYVPCYISGRTPWRWERRRARNLTAEIGIYGLLAGVSVCRVAIGADYWVYWLNFQLIAQERHVSYEKGFQLVVRLMQALFGEGTYRTIFALFSLLTVYFFVRALHDQAKWYAASLYLLLTGGFYFSSMHSVRYYFALAIACFSAKYVLRGEYLKFVLWILFAAAFHKSVLLVIPAYLAARFLASVKLKKWHYILGAALIVSLILGQDLYREIIFYFYPYYEGSAFDTGDISWANVGKCAGTLVLCVFCWKQSLQDKLENRFYFFLNLAALVVYTCGSFIPEVSRVGYYLLIFQIFLLPNLLQERRRDGWRVLFMAGVFAAFALYFVMFLKGAYDDSIRLMPYRTWIFD